MKVSELLAERQQNWAELQQLTSQIAGRGRRRMRPEAANRFATLYRAACADLALADAYQLPPNTVQYLHQLVAQAHNQLYPSRALRVGDWPRELLYRVPRRLFMDGAVRIAFLLFFGMFFGAFLMARYDPQFCQDVIGEENMQAMRQSYSEPIQGRNFMADSSMAGFYIWNNTSIGLRCFGYGLFLFGVGGLFELSFNAIFLGAVFGYMSTTPQNDHFMHFVTAHGPFELTAIVLSAAAGMKLGFSIVYTRGLSRMASLRKAGQEAMPTMGVAIVMFLLAAFIEGFISPSAAPYGFKLAVGGLSCCLLLFYFVMLGMPELSSAPESSGTWDEAAGE